MRLTRNEHEAIKQSFLETFESGKIYLFGSRVDDSLKGGDIDLYLLLDKKYSHSILFEKKLDFLGKVQENIGHQKIDIVISKDTNRSIEQEALRTGVIL